MAFKHHFSCLVLIINVINISLLLKIMVQNGLLCRAFKDFIAQTTANFKAAEIIFKFCDPKEILTDHVTSFQGNLYESFSMLLKLRN